MQKRVTVVSQNKNKSLFESLFDPQTEPQEIQDCLPNMKNIDIHDNLSTKSIKNKEAIFYQKHIDYDDYKFALKYNNNQIKKIVCESIAQPPPKLIKCLSNVDMSGLQELKFREMGLNDSMFILKGLEVFPNLKHFSVFGCNELTTKFLLRVFTNPLSSNTLESLDLGHSQIDSSGLQHLGQFRWPNLNTLNLQWCTKFTDISLLPYAHNFPLLTHIDLRFTMIGNRQLQSILDSPFMFTLKQVRLYGTKVGMEELDLSMYCLFNQIHSMVDLKRTLQFTFIQSNEDQLPKNIEKYLQVSQTHIQRVNVQFVIDPTERLNVDVSWVATNQSFLLFILKNVPTKRLISQVAVWIEALNQLIELELQLQNIDSIDIIGVGDAIAQQKQLKRLSIKITNQKQDQKAYLHLFQSLHECQLIQYCSVQIIIFPDNKINVDKVFLQSLLIALQKLPLLYVLYLNLNSNFVVQDECKEFLTKILNNPMKNHQLLYVYMIFQTLNQFEMSLTDALTLYFGRHLKLLNLNLDECNFGLKCSHTQKYLKNKVASQKTLFSNIKYTIKEFDNVGMCKLMRKEKLVDMLNLIYNIF